MIVIGNYKKNIIAKINPWQIIEGVNIKGAWNSDINFNKKFFKLENIFRKINSDLFFSKKEYKINEINKAIEDFKNGKVIRPLINMK